MMKKIKFKCENCHVTVKRPSGKIVINRSKRYCSDNCKVKEHG